MKRAPFSDPRSISHEPALFCFSQCCISLQTSRYFSPDIFVPHFTVVFFSSRLEVNSQCNEVLQLKYIPKACHTPHVNVLISYTLRPQITKSIKYKKQDFQNHYIIWERTQMANQAKQLDGALLSHSLLQSDSKPLKHFAQHSSCSPSERELPFVST